MTDRRRKNQNWCVAEPDGTLYSEMRGGVMLSVLMDIRDELQALRALANCYRIPRALDAMAELGAEARRKKRAAATKRRNAKAAAA